MITLCLLAGTVVVPTLLPIIAVSRTVKAVNDTIDILVNTDEEEQES